ncbi:hypothetical protein LEP1GSC088_0055 [Leptospira interrogans str. L1207]|nr:hypothetical protein LEP1GSC088_0055 [Leptospira interrogans str. L1207]
MVKGVLLSSLVSIPFALYRIHVSKKKLKSKLVDRILKCRNSYLEFVLKFRKL